MRFRETLMATMLVGAMSTGAAMAADREFVFASYLPPHHNINIHGYTPLFKALEPVIDWSLVTGGQLFSAQATLESVGNQVADAGGAIVPPYYRAKLKHAFIISDLLMLGSNEFATHGATLETFYKDCPSCMEDYRDQNTIFLAGYAVGGYSFLCSAEVTKMSDVEGMKVRTSGALGPWAQALGGVPVSMTSGEMPEALQRGQLDCIAGPVAWLKSYPIEDMVEYIYDYGLGAFGGLGVFLMNRDSWEELSKEQKDALWDRMPTLTAHTMVEGYFGEDLEARALAKEKGIVISPADPAVLEKWNEYKKGEIDRAVANAEKIGVKNAREIAEAFLKNLEKWEGIIEESGLRKDLANAEIGKLTAASEKFEGLLREHIYSKVDYSTL